MDRDSSRPAADGWTSWACCTASPLNLIELQLDARIEQVVIGRQAVCRGTRFRHI